MNYNNSLRKLSIQNVKKIGKKFLLYNRVLNKLIMPDDAYCGNNFLYSHGNG